MPLADSSAINVINSMSTISARSLETCEFHGVLEKLRAHQAITDSQKMQMLAIVDLLHEISNSQSTSAYESLDDSGKRFF